MFVLTRHINESIVINGNIEVTIVSIRGSKVRVGIEAPNDVKIDRKEVYNAMNKEHNPEEPQR